MDLQRKKYLCCSLGTSLSKLPLDKFTLTEVVRLHFLSSGAEGAAANVRFRYQQRGAYSSMDDPGLEFRKHEMAILKMLGGQSIYDLEAGMYNASILGVNQQINQGNLGVQGWRS